MILKGFASTNLMYCLPYYLKFFIFYKIYDFIDLVLKVF